MKTKHFAATLTLAATAFGVAGGAATTSAAPVTQSPIASCATHVTSAYNDSRTALYAARVVAARVHADRVLAQRIGPMIDKDARNHTSVYRNRVIRGLQSTNLWPKLSQSLKTVWLPRFSPRASSALRALFSANGMRITVAGQLSINYVDNVDMAGEPIARYAGAGAAFVQLLTNQVALVRGGLASETCLPSIRAKVMAIDTAMHRLLARVRADEAAVFAALGSSGEA